MPIYKDPKKLKKKLYERSALLRRFNEWERQIVKKPDMANCLSAVFELYDMIPDHAKHRAVNVEGIMKMRKGLACLT